MAGRSTCSNTANNTNPPNETTSDVAQQLNTALLNLLTQLVEALGGNRANQKDVTQNFKTFRSCGAKEFCGTEGVVGLKIPKSKEKNRKWINKAIDEGPYEFKEFTPSKTKPPRMQKQEDLKGDDLKHYKAKIEAINLIPISIPNDIYNSVDACTTAQAILLNIRS
uniref:Uncharacterized protein n=1 Tax=Tanacetum cinerariifolium TaxID=118510 RepID=A0A699HYH4_TANCI|nr:hypothetical protein [Tanacetum cinerariifolium]